MGVWAANNSKYDVRIVAHLRGYSIYSSNVAVYCEILETSKRETLGFLHKLPFQCRTSVVHLY
jgi:hypothetical protein